MNNFSYIPQKNQFSSPYFNNLANEVAASTNNIIWVQGIEGAKAWQLPPNSMVILLDSEVEGKMYIKVSDNIGMSSLRIFDYKEEVQKTSSVETPMNNIDLSQYVKKDELMGLIKEVLNEQSISAVTKTSNSGDTATESNGVTKQPKILFSAEK